MVVPSIDISHHRSMPGTTKSSGKTRRRISASFKNVFRRSSTATSKIPSTTSVERNRVNSGCAGKRNNPSSHSHGTDVTAVTADSSAANSSSVVSSSVPPADAAPKFVRGDTANISDQRTTAATSDHSAMISNNHQQKRPRRSSLKKTSNSGLETLSLVKSTDLSDIDDIENKLEQRTQPKSNKAALADGTKWRPSLRRRRSTTDIPSTCENNVLPSSSSSNPLNRRQSVQFDSCVSFATVPNIDDLIEVGACETDLYYTDEEFANMKRTIRKDARQIKEDRTNFRGDVITCNEPYQQRQNEDDLNEWGIEHHTCTKSARATRAHRVNYVIQSVLREQETQCIDPDSGLLTEVSVLCLARTSAMASQVARVQAQRRASDVERHCRRWSATATTNTTISSTTTSNHDIGRPTRKEKGQQRRHSSCEDVLPQHGNFQENKSDNGDGNDPKDVLSVADASLDESAPRLRSHTARPA